MGGEHLQRRTSQWSLPRWKCSGPTYFALKIRNTAKKKNLGPLLQQGFPGGSDGKESACNAGDLGSSPGLGRSPGEGKGYPLQDSGLENSVDCKVHGVAKSRK